MTLKKRLYTAAETAAAIDRMAAAIVEDCRAAREEDFALVGLYQQGVPLAERLCAAIETLSADGDARYFSLPRRFREEKRSAADPRNGYSVRCERHQDHSRRRRAFDRAHHPGRARCTDRLRPSRHHPARGVGRPIRADYVGFACNPPADHKVAVRFDDDDSAESGIYEVEWK